jgi:hypothetical protein
MGLRCVFEAIIKLKMNADAFTIWRNESEYKKDMGQVAIESAQMSISLANLHKSVNECPSLCGRWYKLR